MQFEWETMTFPVRAAKRRGLKISHCFSQKLQWILFERDKTDTNVILMTLNIRNYRFIANVWGFPLSDKSIVRPAHKAWARELVRQQNFVPCFIWSYMKSHENSNSSVTSRMILQHCSKFLRFVMFYKKIVNLNV